MKKIDHFPLIEIYGSPFNRGLQYGEQARARIAASIDLYSRSLRDLGLSKSEILDLANNFIPKITHWAPDLVDEMKGIAKGASVSLSEIMLINARTEILQLAERGESFVDNYSDGCTGAIIMPKISASGESNPRSKLGLE